MLWEHLMSNLYFAVEQSQNEVNNVKKKKKKKEVLKIVCKVSNLHWATRLSKITNNMTCYK